MPNTIPRPVPRRFRRREIWPQLARVLFIASVTGSLANFSAQAQTINWPAVSSSDIKPVYEMPRVFYDDAGVTLGSFLLKPSASDSVIYDDAIFASDIHRAKDISNAIGEELSVSSQWSGDSIALNVRSGQELYGQHPQEDANSYVATFAGHADLTSTASLEIDGVGGQVPEMRASPVALQVGANRPIYNQWNGALTYTQILGPFVEQFRVGVNQIAFIYSQDVFASHTDHVIGDRITLDGRKLINPFIEVGYLRNDQLFHPDKQSFQNLTALLGVHLKVDEALDAELAAGFLRETYTNPSFQPLTRPIVYGKALWLVTPLTSVVANFTFDYSGVESFCNSGPICQISPSGNVQPVLSFEPGAPDIFDTHRSTVEKFTSNITVQHEIWHNVLGEIGAEYDHYFFDLNNLIDDTYSASGNLRYLVNNYAEVQISYFRRKRSANLPFDYTFNTGPFTENILSVKLNAQL